jgi:pantetheine-phosphate adenylyltransferase
MAVTGFYSGSFDPVTLGHMDVIIRASRLLDRLIIGIGRHPGKAPLFTPEDKVAMLEEATRPIARETGIGINIRFFDGLTVDAAAALGASVIIRGLRDGTDLDYEMQMAGMNGAMAPAIQTVFLPASPGVRHITATLVRQIAMMGGDVSPFVSPRVADLLRSKAGERAGRG